VKKKWGEIITKGIVKKPKGQGPAGHRQRWNRKQSAIGGGNLRGTHGGDKCGSIRGAKGCATTSPRKNRGEKGEIQWVGLGVRRGEGTIT